MDEIKRLPDAELEIMLVIWRSKGQVSSNYILEQFKSQLGTGTGKILVDYVESSSRGSVGKTK